MAKKLILPRVHAMVICDSIQRIPDVEPVHNLVGVRTRILAEEFPYTHPLLCVYLQVTGHPGTASGDVTLEHARTGLALAKQSLPNVPFEGPLVILPLSVRFRRCTFPEAGIYFIQVHFEGKLLGERSLELLEL
jgi:hypothetical protein